MRGLDSFDINDLRVLLSHRCERCQFLNVLRLSYYRLAIHACTDLSQLRNLEHLQNGAPCVVNLSLLNSRLSSGKKVKNCAPNPFFVQIFLLKMWTRAIGEILI